MYFKETIDLRFLLGFWLCRPFPQSRKITEEDVIWALVPLCKSKMCKIKIDKIIQKLYL